ncbi:hypothetical protein [Burkholderia pseudomallei]|uniref:hypothetical protein n=1 Tax=Burkholderia pseudomallei TaxID=28450 RepID=UPI000A1A24AD|nr:hypothetical protein [Burkholderia pseudomallei]ARK96186.1 hypothetical protein BOC43_17080 [Burkholderia pseudomallei]
MAHKLCVCCGDVFEPRPQTPEQVYCSSSACQRARKRQWQREKLRTDSDYRDNQRDAQRAWLSRNPDYWRQYRRDHSDYATSGRARQQGQPHAASASIAKMDACIAPSGVYRLTPVSPPTGVSTDSWLVEITPVCETCPRKMDACKERT